MIGNQNQPGIGSAKSIGGGGIGYIPLAGTDVGNPVTGDISVGEIDGVYRKIYGINPNEGNSELGFGTFEDLLGAIHQWVVLSDTDSLNNTQSIISVTSSGILIKNIYDNATKYKYIILSNESIDVSSNSPLFKGYTGNNYFGANYDDNTYVQKKYVDVSMIPLDYGDIIAVGGIENVQVYTTGSGTGTASVDLLPIIGIGKDVTVSDLANNAGTHNIQIDSGSGNTILYNGTASQDITLNTDGASITIRRMTTTRFMVIARN